MELGDICRDRLAWRQDMIERNLKKIVRILMALAMGLVLILFGKLCFGMDVRIMNTRGPETYQAVGSVSYKEISDKTSPVSHIKPS